MLQGSQMKDALEKAGFVDNNKPKRSRRGKKFKCNVCGTEMVHPDWINVMWCPECERKASYFIFSDKKN